MTLTDAQREAAITSAKCAITRTRKARVGAGASRESSEADRAYAVAATLALTDAGFILLYRDDVTEEETNQWNDPGGTPTLTRLCTRWEPITNE